MVVVAMKSVYSIMAMLVLLSFAFSAQASNIGDNTLPTVVSYSPEMNATNVPHDVTITVVFSEDMNASTLNSSTVVAFNPYDMDFFEGKIGYDNATRTLTFKPTGEVRERGGEAEDSDNGGFHYGARIQFMIYSLAKDINGNRLDGQGTGQPSPFILVFTVENAPIVKGSYIPYPSMSFILMVFGIAALLFRVSCRRH